MYDLGLILAAGQGRRFGGPKAPAVVDGERLVDRAVRVLREGGCEQVIVVLGAWIGEVPEAQVVRNPVWHNGMGSSLQCGLLAAKAIVDADRIVISLVDLPGLTGAAVAEARSRAGRLGVATYQGAQGHPVIIGREWADQLINSVRGDVGAREFLQEHRADVMRIEVGHLADGRDVDTPVESQPQCSTNDQ